MSELRESTIKLVTELLEPVGPFTFAGYGGRLARVRHEAHQAAGNDIVAGVFAGEAQVEAIVRAWVDSTPLPATIDVLLDLFVEPPPAAGRHHDEWREQLTQLLYWCGHRDRAALEASLDARAEVLASLAAELREWFAEDAPTDP